MSAPAPTMLRIDRLRRDGGTQPRDHVSITIAQEYAEALADGDEFPPVTAFFDGTTYWLADGFHRVLAHELIEAAAIAADVRQGALRDAVLFSVGANASHGYRRSNADKRRAVLTLLGDPDWAAWSDREIARRCTVSSTFVGSLRPRVTANVDSEVRTFTSRHGTESTMRVSAIGRSQPVASGQVQVVETSPASRPTCESAAAPRQHDWSQGIALLGVGDLLDTLKALPSPATILDQLGSDIGAFPSLETVLAAGAWMADFAAGYPKVHAARQARAGELEKALRHVAQ